MNTCMWHRRRRTNMAEMSASVAYTKSYEEDMITFLKFEVRDLPGNTEKVDFPIYKDEGEEHYLFGMNEFSNVID